MTTEQLQDMRKRVLNGEPYTKEEFAQAIRAMVGERIALSTKPTNKAKSTKQPVTSLDDLLL